MKRLLFTLLAAGAVMGCAKDEDVAQSSSGNVVKFSSAGIDTRIDVAENKWIAGDRVGITSSGFSNVGGVGGADFENVEYKAESSAASTAFLALDDDSAILYPNIEAGSDVVQFYAYYPYTSVNYNSEVVTVDISDQRDLAAIDFMVGGNASETAGEDTTTVTGYGDGADADVNDTAVKFKFDHKLSKLILNIGVNDNLESIKGLTVMMSGVETTASYSVVDGTQTGSSLGNAKIVSLDVVEGTETDGKVTSATVTAILHPNNYTTSSPMLRFTVGEKIYEVAFTATLLAGKSHTFSLDLGNDVAIFTSSNTIGGWTPGTGGTLYPEDVTAMSPISFACGDFKTKLLANTNLNTDSDTDNISYAEAAAYTGMIDVCYDSDITSMDELKYFPNITELYCYGNDLTSLDLSACTGLISLSCYSNSITSLDLSACTKLTSLDCRFNKLSTLDVSMCTNLGISSGKFFAGDQSDESDVAQEIVVTVTEAQYTAMYGNLTAATNANVTLVQKGN